MISTRRTISVICAVFVPDIPVGFAFHLPHPTPFTQPLIFFPSLHNPHSMIASLVVAPIEPGLCLLNRGHFSDTVVLIVPHDTIFLSDNGSL
jgi:hypothetical protein